MAIGRRAFTYSQHKEKVRRQATKQVTCFRHLPIDDDVLELEDIVSSLAV
jgi:hypothetical protein